MDQIRNPGTVFQLAKVESKNLDFPKSVDLLAYLQKYSETEFTKLWGSSEDFEIPNQVRIPPERSSRHFALLPYFGLESCVFVFREKYPVVILLTQQENRYFHNFFHKRDIYAYKKNLIVAFVKILSHF